MKCIVIKDYGDEIDNLVIEERPDIEASGKEIRVKVEATALNRADLLQRRGLYPPPPGTPEYLQRIPGLEFTGTIDQTGDDVTRWNGGERVFGILPGGGYASQVATHESLVAEVPGKLGVTEAAAIPEAYMTAFDALVLQGGMTRGERVLIHAVASGVGTAAVQLAHVWGAEAVGTAGSAAKLERVGALAPFFPVNYREADFRHAIEAKFGPNAIDIVLDVVGGDYWERNLAVLKTKGRLVLVGRMRGSGARTPLGTVMSKRLHIIGTVMRSRPLEEKIEVTVAFNDEVIPALRDGRLKPVVDSVYPFEDVREATARMEKNQNTGKIVLTLS